ncbi:MAG TPA: hypothetical protein VGI03_14905 [Verrucomicrobiae bacterium]
MKSIVTNYPDFHALPKGLKRLLVVSETFFFEDARPSTAMMTVQKLVLRTWKPQEIAGAGFFDANNAEQLQAWQ